MHAVSPYGINLSECCYFFWYSIGLSQPIFIFYSQFWFTIQSLACLHRIATNTHTQTHIYCDSTLRLAFITVVVLFANRFELNWNEKKRTLFRTVVATAAAAAATAAPEAHTLYTESHIRDGVYLIKKYATPSNYSVEQSKNVATQKIPSWTSHTRFE